MGYQPRRKPLTDEPKRTTRGQVSEACHHVAKTLLEFQKDAQAVVVIEAWLPAGADAVSVSCVALERTGVDPKKWIKAVYDEIRAMAEIAGVVEPASVIVDSKGRSLQ